MSENLRCHDAARLLTYATSVASRIARLNKVSELDYGINGGSRMARGKYGKIYGGYFCKKSGSRILISGQVKVVSRTLIYGRREYMISYFLKLITSAEKEEERLGDTLEEHCQLEMFRADSDRFESSLLGALNSVLDELGGTDLDGTELGGTAVEVDLVHVQSLKKEKCCILAQVELEKWKLKNLKQKIAELEHHSIKEALGDEHESDVIEDSLSTLKDDVVSTGDYEDSYNVKDGQESG